jgi:hypothetical protein
MKFRIDLAFRTVPAPLPWLARFLNTAPRIWQRFCSADTIQFTVCEIKQPTPLALQVVLDVIPAGLDSLSDLDIYLATGSDPQRIRCTAALYVWLNSLKRVDGPMTPAWRFFWCTSTEDSPVFLDRYIVDCIEPLRFLPPSKQTLTDTTSTDEVHNHTPLHRSHSAPVRLNSGGSDAVTQSEGPPV